MAVAAELTVVADLAVVAAAMRAESDSVSERGIWAKRRLNNKLWLIIKMKQYFEGRNRRSSWANLAGSRSPNLRARRLGTFLGGADPTRLSRSPPSSPQMILDQQTP